MSVDRNVLRVVEYHANPARRLRGASWAFCAGVVFLLIARDEPRFAYFFGWPLLAVAACFVGLFLWRKVFAGRPILVLSPQGIVYRVGGLSEVFIPWQIIGGVEEIDFCVGRGKREIRAENVTVVRVPEAFYREYFHVGALHRSAVGWEWYFRLMGEDVGIAIHHEWFLLHPEEVREPIETRWLAFRDNAPALPDTGLAGSRFGREGGHLVLGTHALTSGWDAAMVGAPLCVGLVGLAYLLGTA